MVFLARPYRFGAVFYQTYSEIIKKDVENTVFEFFIETWMMSKFNANILIMIHHIRNDDTDGQYIPIVLDDIKSKIISNIILLIGFLKQNEFK